MRSNIVSDLKIGILLSYFNVGLTAVSSFLYTPYLLKMLGQKEYGVFSIAFSTLALLTVLDFGLGNANIKYTSKFRAEGDKVKENRLHSTFFVLYSAIGILVLIFGLIFYFKIPDIFSKNMSIVEVLMLQKMVLFITVSISVSFPLSVYGFIIKGYEKFVFSQVTELIRIVLVPTISVILLYSGKKSVPIVSAITCIYVLLLLFNSIYCFFKLKIRINFRAFDVQILKEILGFSVFVFIGFLAFQIDINSNQLILGIVSGSVSVAIYALGFNLVINFRQLSTSISSLFLPVISRIPDDENQMKEFDKYFVAFGRLQFYVLSLFFWGFVFFGQQFIILWAGDDYVLSYWIVVVLTFSQLFYLVQSVGIPILQVKNKHKNSSLLFILMSVLNLILSFYLSKEFGALGSSVSLSFVWLLGYLVIMNFYYKKSIGLKIHVFWTQILKIFIYFIPSIIFGVVYHFFLSANNWMNLIIGVVGFTIIYCASIVFFSFNEFEKKLIVDPIKSLIQNGSK